MTGSRDLPNTPLTRLLLAIFCWGSAWFASSIQVPDGLLRSLVIWGLVSMGALIVASLALRLLGYGSQREPVDSIDTATR